MRPHAYSLALTSRLHAEAQIHLLRADGQEDLCFGLWFPSRGSARTTALLSKLLLPEGGERHVHGNVSFLPSYFERAIGEATSAGAGLAFLHSHSGPGWQCMSGDDIRAEESHAAAAKGATDLPLVGLTLGTDGSWSARFWEKIGQRNYQRRWCSQVRVVGERLSITYADNILPPPQFKEELQRTTSCWGAGAQADLARLHVGIIGAGSVGAIVGEALARIGIRHVSLIDFDTVELLNLDRLLHASRLDALLKRSKVQVLARAMRRGSSAGQMQIDEIEKSVAEEDGYRAALNCDILFSCVDRPLARSILNFIAYAHLIPVVDGGIRVRVSKAGLLRSADWRAHIASPERRCLECLDQYNPGLVAAEREGYFDDPRYIEGLPDDHPIRRNENVFAFSLSAAGFEVLQMLAMVVAPCGFANAGEQMYHFVPGLFDNPGFHCCKDTCLYPTLIARGDRADVVVTGRHLQAEKARLARASYRQSLLWRHRILEFLCECTERLTRALAR